MAALKRAVIGSTCVVALVAAGCSTSSKSSTVASSVPSTAATALTVSSAPARGVTADSIKVGGFGFKLAFGDQAIGAQARFARANSEGGVFGRKIDYVGYQDDTGDVSKDVDIAHQLVEEDKVFAVVPVTSTVFNAAGYFAESHVPFFGWAINPNWCGNDWAFGYDGCLQPAPGTTTGDVFGPLMREVFGGPITGKTMAVLGEDSPAGKQVPETSGASMKAAGFTVVYAEAPVPAPPAIVGDWTPYAEQLMTSNGGKAPDAIFLGIFPTNIPPLTKKLRDLGYKGRVFNAVLYNPFLSKAAAGLDADTYIDHAPFETTPAPPGLQQFMADMKAFSPSTALSSSAIQGWLSADLFLSILQKVGPNLTPESFDQVANDNFSWEVPGVAGKAVFPAFHNLGGVCYADVETKDGVTWTVVAKLACGTEQLVQK